jgi:hypothetical protein
LTRATESTPLAYATPNPRGGSPVLAGFWIVVAGLALIFFGGCFCIGILLMVSGAANVGFNPGYSSAPIPPWTWHQSLLMFLLYTFAFGCFAGGAVTLVIGIRKLMAVGR